MPELPEVETIRRQLDERITGRVIRRLRVFDPMTVSPDTPRRLARRVAGRRIERVSRRGKYLRLELDGGDTLAVHLRMTGQLHWSANGDGPPEPYRRARLELDDGSAVDMRDMRRFGRIWLVPAEHPDAAAYWDARTGVEPLGPDFTAARLAELLAGRRAPVKAALLDQRLVAGVGNIYADEALYQARIHPLRPAGDLGPDELRRLHRAVRDRLKAGIDSGGASIDRYRDAINARGSMQDLLAVHLHAGEPCPRCGTTIEKIRVAQRGTYVCPGCQPPPR
ncbi:MAG TPA: bifunctional DNA-formamidopyrimidine glycosylase/DNA-(apurinic or apyrimidinic site) lyase [Miltoncostaeaceae bacterium]|nr:bifunctional DNA-formamidopyrimidine glycosylase/DNA-(apurinic or apyrimidinic site) lyase [Miltoncostaeaceae bacterium]